MDIVAEIDRQRPWGATGVRSLSALVAWKSGMSPANAHTITTIAERLPEFPHCAAGLREGRLSLDQVGVIATRATDGSDAHCAQLAQVATVTQLRTAIKLAPRPTPDPKSELERSIHTTTDDTHTTWRMRLPHPDAEVFQAALASHRDA